MKLEILCGFELPVTLLYQFPTVAQLSRALEHKTLPARPQSLVQIQEGAGGPPLFWLPGASSGETVLMGHAPYIARLAAALGPAQPVYSIYQEYAPAGASQTLAEIAAGLVAEIQSVQPSGPYYLAGWSFGALAAYEIARQLQLRGESVALLALLDTLASGSPRRRPWRSRPAAFLREWKALTLAGQVSYPLTKPAKYFYEQFTAFRRRFGLTNPAPNPWERTIRIEAEFFSQPRPYPGHVLVFASEETLASTRHRVSVEHDPALGWPAIAASVEPHVIPGDHYTIFDELGMVEMARLLRARLPASAGLR